MTNDMGNVFVKTAVVDVGIQWGLWLIAAIFKTEKFYDLAGSGTIALLAYQTLQWNKTHFFRQTVQSRMVMLWAFRLGMFLFIRILKYGHDRRFNHVRTNPGSFFVYWTIQALWVYVTLLPTMILNTKNQDSEIGTRDYVGWSMWFVGFVIEALADYQKSIFRNNPANEGKFIQHGLWSISRHPNYFGEILLWFGLYLSASSSMKGYEYASVLSPMFIAVLLTKVSGIPILEKYGMKKWSGDPSYLEYTRRTPLLIPFLY